jgi:hypothetical protein
VKSRHTETVTIVRPTRDRHGDDISDTEFDVAGCAIWTWMSRTGGSPASHSLETTFEQETVVFGLSVLFPAGTDIRSSDKVRARGELYQVYGSPDVLRSPLTGREPGILVNIRGGTG